MRDLIEILSYAATAGLFGFAVGVAWERHRWEERETYRLEAEANASLDRIARAHGNTFNPQPSTGALPTHEGQ